MKLQRRGRAGYRDGLGLLPRDDGISDHQDEPHLSSPSLVLDLRIRQRNPVSAAAPSGAADHAITGIVSILPEALFCCMQPLVLAL